MRTKIKSGGFLLLLAGVLFAGCNANEDTYIADGEDINITETLPEGAYDTEVGSTVTVEPALHSLTVTWTEPAEPKDLSHYLVEWKGSTLDAALYSRTVKRGVNTTVLERVFNEEYTVTVKCVSTGLLVSTGVTGSGTPIADNTAPSSVSDVKVTPMASSSGMTWVNPTDTDFESLEITVIKTDNDSTIVNIVLGPTVTAYTVAGLQDLTDYQVTIVAKDYLGNSSEVVQGFKTLTERTIAKSAWAITDFSSEETAGDPGAATNAIDGDHTTFWHSNWTSGSQLPQYIVIDLQQEVIPTVLVSYKRSANNNGPTLVKVEGSTDQTNWSDFGTHALKADDDAGQACYLINNVSSRYIKYTVQGAPSGFAMVREIDIRALVSE